MSPNPIALELGKTTGRGYNEARIALNTLEAHDWRVTDAVRFLLDGAKSGANLVDLARGAVAQA